MRNLELALDGNAAAAVVLPTTMLVEHAIVDESLQVSVVMPTRNRRTMLERAVRSVADSQYSNWQLVVVDDGSTDGTPNYLASLDDPRIVVVRSEGEGAAAARNRGLDKATGTWVTFLDDDNVMSPFWPKAIADFGHRHPAARVLCGAQIRQREEGIGRSDYSWTLFAGEISHASVIHHNMIDLAALAVRRDVDQLWFDEELTRFIDWELIARLSANETIHTSPVLAGLYFSRHGGRLTDTGGDAAVAAFHARLADPNDSAGKPGPRRRPDARR